MCQFFILFSTYSRMNLQRFLIENFTYLFPARANNGELGIRQILGRSKYWTAVGSTDPEAIRAFSVLLRDGRPLLGFSYSAACLSRSRCERAVASTCVPRTRAGIYSPRVSCSLVPLSHELCAAPVRSRPRLILPATRAPTTLHAHTATFLFHLRMDN